MVRGMSLIMIKLAVPLLSLVVGLTFVSSPMGVEGPVLREAIPVPEAEVGGIRAVEMDPAPGEEADQAPAGDAPVDPGPVVE